MNDNVKDDDTNKVSGTSPVVLPPTTPSATQVQMALSSKIAALKGDYHGNPTDPQKRAEIGSQIKSCRTALKQVEQRGEIPDDLDLGLIGLA